MLSNLLNIWDSLKIIIKKAHTLYVTKSYHNNYDCHYTQKGYTETPEAYSYEINFQSMIHKEKQNSID